MLTTAKWTIADYHSMVAAGILAGRQVELLQGEIVEMPPEGEPHAYASDEAAEYLIYLLADRAFSAAAAQQLGPASKAHYTTE